MRPLLFSLFLSFGTCTIQAQTLVSSIQPDDLMRRQADSMRNLLMDQDFILEKEAAVPMESQYEYPIVAPLKGGTWYQIVFIGVLSSRLLEVRMYDMNEKQVFYKKHQWGDIDGTIISYRYTPRFDEFHMIKVLQINKRQRKLPGYVMLFRRTHSQLEIENQDERYGRKGKSTLKVMAPAENANRVPNSTLPARDSNAVDSTRPAKTDSAGRQPVYEQIMRGRQ